MNKCRHCYAAHISVAISEMCNKLTGKIKPAKLQDVQKQLPYIPDTYKSFYIEAAETDCHSSSETDTDVEPSEAEALWQPKLKKNN